MDILIKKYYILNILCFYNFISLGQALKNNFNESNISLKLNAGFFIDNDDKRFENARINPTSVNYPLPVLSFGQSNYSGTTFPGAELSYYYKRQSFFGMNIGVSYSYNQTKYNYFYSDNKYLNTIKPQKEYTKKISHGSGNGILKNHLIKFVFGFNFNTKFGLNAYIQPLNPELRLIFSKYSVTYDTYYTYLYTTGVNIGKDSVSNLINTETKKINFENLKTRLPFSIAFPTLIGIEQKFKIGKLTYVAGASASASLLEWYVIYRAHIGVCLYGRIKSINK